MKTMSKDYFEFVSISTWKLSTLMSIVLMTKVTRNMGMSQPFHNKSDVIASSENMWTNSNVQMYNILEQNNII